MVTYKVEAPGVHPAILSVNRQTYLEASKLFYSENWFRFTCNTCIIPFLKDRPEGSRRLIKQIDFRTVILTFTFLYLERFRHLEHVFEETCTYLKQSLQLEQITLRYFDLTHSKLRNRILYKDCLSNIDKQSWVRQLVPLVKNLTSLRLIELNHGDDDLMLAAQTYLRSMMDKASKEGAPESGCSRAGT